MCTYILLSVGLVVREESIHWNQKRHSQLQQSVTFTNLNKSLIVYLITCLSACDFHSSKNWTSAHTFNKCVCVYSGIILLNLTWETEQKHWQERKKENKPTCMPIDRKSCSNLHSWIFVTPDLLKISTGNLVSKFSPRYPSLAWFLRLSHQRSRSTCQRLTFIFCKL